MFIFFCLIWFKLVFWCNKKRGRCNDWQLSWWAWAGTQCSTTRSLPHSLWLQMTSTVQHGSVQIWDILASSSSSSLNISMHYTHTTIYMNDASEEISIPPSVCTEQERHVEVVLIMKSQVCYQVNIVRLQDLLLWPSFLWPIRFSRWNRGGSHRCGLDLTTARTDCQLLNNDGLLRSQHGRWSGQHFFIKRGAKPGTEVGKYAG